MRWRAALWRGRFLVAAAALALATALGLQSLRAPAPATVSLLVAAHDLAAGTTLADSDVRVAHVPASAAVDAAFRDPAEVLGAGTAVPVPAGLPLVPGLLATAEVGGPAGTVVAAVRLSDPAVAALLAPGTRVDVLAATPETGESGVVVARRALVLPVPGTGDDGAGGGLGLGGADRQQDASPVLLAVQPDEAPALAGAAASALLSVVVVP
ncbi:hypothetical protein CCO02nite_16740 [Cellulomonas composti]|uniref:SAF domain-containing protein n=2 Tax=Cellulomonas composti TaxID=266130 RepID=A0A511JAK0_9CELL|nr:hypothetical protein CCO02nite_16740 [Cellulomonas composti]